MRSLKISLQLGLAVCSLVFLALFQNCSKNQNLSTQGQQFSSFDTRSDVATLSNSTDTLTNNVLGSESRTERVILGFGDSRTRGANPLNPLNTGIKGYAPTLQRLLGVNAKVINCGIGGQTTRDAKDRFFKLLEGDYQGYDRVGSPNCSQDTIETGTSMAFYDFSTIQGKIPTEIIVWLGTNNLLLKQKKLNFFDAYSDLYEMIKAAKNKLPAIKIILLTVPPYDESIPDSESDSSIILNLDNNKLNRVEHFNSLIRRLAAEFKDITMIDIYSLLAPKWSTYNWDGIHLNAEANDLVANEIFKQMTNPTAAKVDPNSPLQLNCTTGSGYLIPHGLFACSCASGSRGEYYQCKNSTWVPAGKLNQVCAKYLENYGIINYHCPKLTATGCVHPITGQILPLSTCKDQTP